MPTEVVLRKCTALLPVLVILFCCSETQASTPDNDCLWISYGERIRGKNNEVAQPVKINFGRFPDGRKDLPVSAKLQAFCFFNDGSVNSEWHRKALDLSGRDKDGFIPIPTREHDHVLIYAMAELQSGDGKTVYSAKSAFSRFTRKKPVKPFDLHPTAADPLGLDIVPRFHYWRQIGETLKISTKPSYPAEPSASLYLLDEHAEPKMLICAKDGSASCTLQDDKTLNAQSSKASKIGLVYAEKREGNHRYVSTFSMLLHRSRIMHRNYKAGLAVIAGTMILSLAVVLRRRRQAEC